MRCGTCGRSLVRHATASATAAPAAAPAPVEPATVKALRWLGYLLIVAGIAAFVPLVLSPLDRLGGLSTAVATLDDRYLERREMRNGVNTRWTNYDISYVFSAKGRTYTGSCTTTKTPKPEMTVYYRTADPSVSGMDLRTDELWLMAWYAAIWAAYGAVRFYRMLVARSGGRIDIEPPDDD